jgi:hypothetical protein
VRLEAWHVRFHMCDVPAFGSAFWELKLQMFYATIGYELYAQDIGICILVDQFFFFLSLGTQGKPLELLMASRISFRGSIFRMVEIGFGL